MIAMRIPTGKPDAYACVRGGADAPKLRGTVNFYTVSGGTLVTAKIRGLPQNGTGFYGLHIHEGKDCGGVDFAGTGGHYNPGRAQHPRHEGDLPPLLSDGGCAWAAFVTGRFTPGEAVGRTVVIHENPDDFHTQPAGNAGKKIACGVIRRG